MKGYRGQRDIVGGRVGQRGDDTERGAQMDVPLRRIRGERQTVRQIDGRKERQKNRQAKRETDRDKETDIQID